MGITAKCAALGRLPVFYALKLIFSISRLQPLLIIAQKLLSGLMPMLQVLAVAKFIDSALAVAAKTAPVQAVLWPLGAIGAIMLYSQLAEKLVYFARVRLVNRLRARLGERLLEKYAELAWKNLENTETADLIARVMKEPEQRLISLFEQLTGAIALVITIVSLVSIIIAQAWWAGLIIVAVSTPLFWLAIKSGKANYEADRITTKYRRRYEYLGEVLAGRDAVDERTLFGYSGALNKVWKENFEIARKIIFRAQLIWFAKMKTGGLIASVVLLLIIFALLPAVVDKEISVGMFIALVNAVFSLVQRLTWELTWYVDEIIRGREYITDMMAFYKLEETAGAAAPPATNVPAFEKLEFLNVSFSYPGTERQILHQLSFAIERGKHYAFVGLNGAGKTTITKLITGLYNDFDGQILLNGRPIREYDQRQLKALCAVAWQDFARYQISFADNLYLGNVNTALSSETDSVAQALATLDLQDVVATLPDGMQTQLGKIREKGVDLSGGQWQRLALARFMLNPASLRILDEPTAALDPVSESNLYEKFEHISRGRSTIFISHRLGSTKLADHIFVIDNGSIAEEGSHDQLMEQAGIYYGLYESQRGWYQ
ncbi:MAG: ABC transporter ATP-binding protein [Bacillota bacterium]